MLPISFVMVTPPGHKIYIVIYYWLPYARKLLICICSVVQSATVITSRSTNKTKSGEEIESDIESGIIVGITVGVNDESTSYGDGNNEAKYRPRQKKTNK